MTPRIVLQPFYDFLSTLPSEEGQYVYILKLQEDKYYVGYTTNVARRVIEHMFGKGSIWTSRYKPVELVRFLTFRSWAKAIEGEKRVTIFLARRGFDVRGGPWTQVNPPKTMEEAKARQQYNEKFGDMARDQYRQQWQTDLIQLPGVADPDTYSYEK